MHWVDWAIVAAFLGLNIGIGVFFSRKGGKNMDSFFVSGRSLKWYIAGASMIATSFAADTPLWVGSLIRQYGIHAVWQYWTPLIGCALGVALFSRMWRRTGVVTDNEVLELRYSGKSAQALRGISAALGALLICPMIIGWVCKAMVTIAQEALGRPHPGVRAAAGAARRGSATDARSRSSLPALPHATWAMSSFPATDFVACRVNDESTPTPVGERGVNARGRERRAGKS